MVSLNVHNILDYVIGAALVVSPWVFGFSDIDAARNTFLVLGFGLIGYSALTAYRYSLAKLIPVNVHMGMDVTAGLVAMIAPWLFNYDTLLTGSQLAVHFIAGLGAVGLVALTDIRAREVVEESSLQYDNVTPITAATSSRRSEEEQEDRRKAA